MCCRDQRLASEMKYHKKWHTLCFCYYFGELFVFQTQNLWASVKGGQSAGYLARNTTLRNSSHIFSSYLSSIKKVRQVLCKLYGILIKPSCVRECCFEFYPMWRYPMCTCQIPHHYVLAFCPLIYPCPLDYSRTFSSTSSLSSSKSSLLWIVYSYICVHSTEIHPSLWSVRMCRHLAAGKYNIQMCGHFSFPLAGNFGRM